MNNRGDLLTVDILKQADERIKKNGWVSAKTKLPSKRKDHFAKINKKAEKLVALFNK
ncbi:hypothetical protein [Clostridium felsineum]|uniref:hypothetical protein n=1 Tax=Clostridium felsineum TaxID=36839 RepID=UPI0009CD981E|nr:hypothetical protein [Clostridium felsineum]URZ04105.1 hypothetical protein CLAUR_041930 [Clostridium felsineum]